MRCVTKSEVTLNVYFISMDPKYIHFDMVQTSANMKSLHMSNRMICNIMYV